MEILEDFDQDWFTVGRIDETTYALSEWGHYEEVHSYVLIGDERAIVLDTGLGIGDFAEIVRALTAKPIEVVTSHVHWDHIGSHDEFDEIAVHEREVEWLADGMPDLTHEEVRVNLTHDLSQPLPDGFDPDAYEVFTGEPSCVLTDGETIDLGDRQLTVLHTPGHSPGHICLHEPDRGYLFTADLIYRGPLYLFLPTSEPAAFASSVRRLTALDDVEQVLPSHNEFPADPTLLDQVENAVDELESQGQFSSGSGEFGFEAFSIRL
ncbi:MAG: MBL fold metallo-hydrolase [Halobacteriales archaeon]